MTKLCKQVKLDTGTNKSESKGTKSDIVKALNQESDGRNSEKIIFLYSTSPTERITIKWEE